MTKQTKRLGFKELLLSLLLMIIVWAAREFFSPAPDSGANDVGPSAAIQAFFTTPRYPDDASFHSGGLDEQLVAAIDAAHLRVDVAAFDLDLKSVTDALIRAHHRGVPVRLVTDSDYADELGPTRLREAGIPVVTDNRSPFMHDKFVIIDGNAVWTGSWNLTDNGTYRNNNNAVVIQSAELAENYTLEFGEMFDEKSFGPTSPDVVPYPDLTLGGTRIETFFESEGDVRDRIIELIQQADTSVRFMAFTFTDDGIAQAIIDRHRAGIPVSGIIEARSTEDAGSDFGAFRTAGVDVLEDGNPYILHHKVIILDGDIVVTGSYNFSANAADENDENVVIIHDNAIATAFVAEFDRDYQLAVTAEGNP